MNSPGQVYGRLHVMHLEPATKEQFEAYHKQKITGISKEAKQAKDHLLSALAAMPCPMRQTADGRYEYIHELINAALNILDEYHKQ